MRLFALIWCFLACAAWADAPVIATTVGADNVAALALARRPELAVFRADVTRSAAESLAAAAQLRPSGSVSFFGVTQTFGMIYTTAPQVTPTFYGAEPPGQVGDLNLTVMAPLSTGGRLEAAHAASRATHQAAESQLQFEAATVVHDARTRYIQALLDRELLRVQDERVSQAEEAQRQAADQFAAGRIAHVDLLRVQSELADAQQGRNNAGLDAAMRLAELKTALGVSQASSLTLVDDLRPGPPPPPLPELLAQARQRGDLDAARRQVDAARQRLAAARGEYAPELYLEGMAEGQGVVGEGVQAGPSVGLVASVPLFDGGTRRAHVMAAQADVDRQAAQLETLSQQAALQVTQAQLAMTAQAENVRLTEPVVAQAEESYRVARLRFEAGRGILLEVLDSLTTLVRARVDRLQALAAYRTAEADLLLSLGEVQ
ncbi:MAG: TolC family protein [Candidatus Xenobia bacterium]